MALDQNYYSLWFESFRLASTSGHRDPIQIKLIPGQNIPIEMLRVSPDQRTPIQGFHLLFNPLVEELLNRWCRFQPILAPDVLLEQMLSEPLLRRSEATNQLPVHQVPLATPVFSLFDVRRQLTPPLSEC